jgi:hypothetical protein
MKKDSALKMVTDKRINTDLRKAWDACGLTNYYEFTKSLLRLRANESTRITDTIKYYIS